VTEEEDAAADDDNDDDDDELRSNSFSLMNRICRQEFT
jgi:hypothetical protein